MRTRIWIALISVYIFWGATYLAIRIGVETFPPFSLAGIRFLIAGAILYIWRKNAGDVMPTKIEWRSAIIIGLLMLLGANGGVVWAEQTVTSGITALIIGSVPLFMVLIDALRPGGEIPRPMAVLGVVLGFGGIIYLVSPSQYFGITQEVDLVGAGVLLVASLLWSLGSIYTRNAELPDSPLLATSMEMLAGGVGLLLLAGISGEWGRFDIAAISMRSWLGLGYLIVFGSLMAFVAYTWLLRVAPTPLVATYAYVNPIVALLLGSLIAGELLTERVLISAVVIVGSIVLINTQLKPSGDQLEDRLETITTSNN